MSEETTSAANELPQAACEKHPRAFARTGDGAHVSQSELKLASTLAVAQAACARCGSPEAAKFGDEFICDDCYVACGSCCAGEE